MRKRPRTSAHPSDQLRAIISARGLSGYAVATAAGLAASVINRWLKGDRSLSLNSFDLIVASLGLKLVEGSRRGRAPAPRPPADDKVIR